ncbi:MAG: hypothetical protein KC493_08745 [Bacteriovoracaceae bacterium]|nr:hypothetical protein [Bacteriovoracaceae bacterium]
MKHLFMLMTLLFTTLTFASDSDFGRATYTGDRGQEVINLLTESTRTEYRWVRVPYQERICRYETRYRQECRTEPGRRVCRQEPGRRVCRQTPPTRQCRTRPDGRQICRDRPGRQVCRTEPGRRVCRTEPGRRVCRQVPYQHQVCRMETRYRDERRAHTVVDQRTNAQVTFTFRHPIWEVLGVKVDLNAELNRDMLTVRAEDFSSPRMLLKDTVRRSDTGGRIDRYINENHEVSLVEADRMFAPMRGLINASDIVNNLLRVNLAAVHYNVDTNFSLRISNNGSEIFNRVLTFNEYRLSTTPQNRSRLELDLAALIGQRPLGSQLVIDFTVSANPAQFLNAHQFTEWSKTHSFSRVLR